MSKNEKNVGSGETEAASYEDKEEEDGGDVDMTVEVSV